MAERLSDVSAQIRNIRQLEAVVAALRGIAASRAQQARFLLAGIEAYSAIVSRAIGHVHDSIREGESIAEPLAQSKICDDMVVNMVDVGEETGDLDKMLLKIADQYDEDVDVAVAGMSHLIEPLMIVGLGGCVGFIVVSLFLPLIKLMNSLGGG